MNCPCTKGCYEGGQFIVDYHYNEEVFYLYDYRRGTCGIYINLIYELLPLIFTILFLCLLRP